MEARTAYILTIGLAALLMAVILWQRQRSGKTITVWLASAALGILLGMVGTFAFARLAGYELTRIVPLQGVAAAASVADSGENQGGNTRRPEGSPEGQRGFAGSRGSNPRRDLVSTVRKLDLLTGDVAVALNNDQAAALVEVLEDIEMAESMTDEEAQARHEEVLALLTDDQKVRLDAIGLPRTSFGGRGEGPPRSGEGGGESAPDANPFKQEATAESVTRLRERFSQGMPPAEKRPEPPK